MPESDFKQLHINIPMEMYNDLMLILPERGMVTFIIRRLLKAYIDAANSNYGYSVSDVAAEVASETEKYE